MLIPDDERGLRSRTNSKAIRALLEANCISPSMLDAVGPDRILRQIRSTYGDAEENRSHYLSANRFFGSRLRINRLNHDMTTNDMVLAVNETLKEVCAESISLSNRSVIYKMENGDRGVCLLYGMAIAKTLGMTTEEVFSPWLYHSDRLFQER
jgi:DNA-binding XRE family transcriptional regulator